MTVEGVFPKVDGDVLYASEVNRFARAGRFITISGTPVALSGTGYQTLGSVLIGAGSLSNPCHINITYWFGRDSTGTDQIFSPRIRISGLSSYSSGNILFSGTNAVSASEGTCDIMLGSPGSGIIIHKGFGINTNANDLFDNAPSTRISKNNIDNFNTGSPVVIFFDAQNAGAGSCTYRNISIQAFRGNY